MTYSQKLKDPRWQRKRLEILEKRGFACENCENEAEELHVHHNLYRKGKNPWEYQDYELRALCKTCHGSEEEYRNELLSILGLVPGNYPLLDILEAVKDIMIRDDGHKFADWCYCAAYPDLMEEAHQRMVVKMNPKVVA